MRGRPSAGDERPGRRARHRRRETRSPPAGPAGLGGRPAPKIPSAGRPVVRSNAGTSPGTRRRIAPLARKVPAPVSCATSRTNPPGGRRSSAGLRARSLAAWSRQPPAPTACPPRRHPGDRPGRRPRRLPATRPPTATIARHDRPSAHDSLEPTSETARRLEPRRRFTQSRSARSRPDHHTARQAAQVATESNARPGRNRVSGETRRRDASHPSACQTPGKQPVGHARGRPPAGCQLPEVSRSLSSINSAESGRRRLWSIVRPSD